MGAVYATIEDVISLKRSLTDEEKSRAGALLPVISAILRSEAQNCGRDLDVMIEDDPDYAETVKSVTVDVLMRELLTSTRREPMSQASESALGYSISGTFLSPGGGIFIKRDELKRLGLKRQRYGAIDLYGGDRR